MIYRFDQKGRAETVKIIAIYILFGIFWVYGSDTVVDWFVHDRTMLVKVAVVKGSFFILCTAGLLYFLINRYVKRLAAAEDRLNESMKYYQAIFNATNEAIIVHDAANGRIVDINNRMLEVYGYEPNEALSVDIDQLSDGMPPYSPADVFEKLSKSKGESLQCFEWHTRKKNGELFWAEVSLTRVSLNDSDGIIAVIRDISERRKAEEAIHQSEEKFRTLFMSLNEGFYLSELIYDDKGNPCDYRYLEANPKFAEMLGVGRDQIIGKRYKELVPVDTTQWLDNYFNVALTGEPCTYSFCSNEYSAYFETYAYQPAKGQVSVLVINVTERKWAEEALRESEEKFRVLAETSPAAIIVYQGDMLVYANPSTVRLFGYSGIELLGMKSWEWVHPDDRGMMIDNERARQRGELVPAQYELRFVKKNGEEGWMIVSAGCIDYQGKPAGIATFVDITETKRAEEKVRSALAEKVILLKEVHHRVKNNLQIICSLLDLQSDSIPDEQSRNYFRESQNRVRSMALIHGMLYESKDFSSIHFGEYIRDLTQHLIASYELESRRISLKVDVNDFAMDIDRAIPCGLIINELVSNAMKHAFPDNRRGEILICFTIDEKRWISLTVADTGVGIPSWIDYENTHTLGLQLVNTLVRQLRGRMTARVEQTGTIISIIFPEKSVLDS